MNEDIFMRVLEHAAFPLPCKLRCHSVLFRYCQSTNVSLSLFINAVTRAGVCICSLTRDATLTFKICLAGMWRNRNRECHF